MKIFGYPLKKWHLNLLTGLPVFFFLLWKFSCLTFRFGDSNAYFYMADQLFKGIFPYRDYFLADPPAMIMLLGVFKLIVGKSIILLQAVPFLFEAANAWLLYLILKKEKVALAFLAPALYLFSFSVLATSDFVTGVQLVNFFALLGFYSYQKNNFKTSGFFWGLAFLVKLYGVFLLLGFFIFLLKKKCFREIFSVSTGIFLALLFFLFPFFLLAPKETFADLILHHFNRPGSGNKLEVFLFFFKKEWLLILLASGGLIKSRKWSLGLPILALFLFLVFFQDLYYTYFEALIPFSVLLAVLFLDFIHQSLKWKEFLPVLGFIYLIFLTLGSATYQKNHLPFGQFSNAKEIAKYLLTQEKGPLYGSHEVAPLIALLSEAKLLNNHIDTNPQTFGSHVNDLGKNSQEALANQAYLIARITRSSEQGSSDLGTEGYFDQTLFQKNCRELKNFPSPSKEWDNLIVIYRCAN